MGTMNINVAALAAKAMNLNGFGYDEGFLKLYSRPSECDGFFRHTACQSVLPRYRQG